MAQRIQDFCEDKAKKGDGAFAVAYALLELAEAQWVMAKALQNLGTAETATPMGAIELLASEVKRMAEAVEGISDALRSA